MRSIKYSLLLGLLSLFRPATAQEDGNVVPEQREVFQKLVFFGNVHGLGGGLHFAPLSWLGMDGFAGIQMPYSILFSAPFHGNQLSTSVRLRGMHPSGVYLTAGWFGGWYEAVNKSEDHKYREHFQVQALQAGIGFAWPPPPTDSQLLIEAGILSGLPEEVQTKTDGHAAFYTITSRRARGINDDLYPFITVLFQF